MSMFKAIGIELKKDISNASSCVDISRIKIQTNNKSGTWILPKALVYGLVKEGVRIVVCNPNVVHQPILICAESSLGELYVRSESDDIQSDNLLMLPRIK